MINNADNYVAYKALQRSMCVKNKNAAQRHEMPCARRQATAMLKAGEITQEDYDHRRYRYPEFDTTQRWAKEPSQALSDMFMQQKRIK